MKYRNAIIKGDIAGVHAALKCALGPTPHLTVVLRDIPCLKGLIKANAGQSTSFSCMALKYYLRSKHLTLDQMPVADHLENHANLF